jgi:hypothetical protein
MLAIRASSPLFRLQTADEIMNRVEFHNTGPGQIPGVIVMSISDRVGDDLDPAAVVVWSLFNPTDDDVTYTVVDLVGADIVLHPVLAGSVDDIVRSAAFDAANGEFRVPARTTAVFVELQDTTAPRVKAKLKPLNVKHHKGWFRVRYACYDDQDPSPSVTATLNGVSVDDGTKVFLKVHRWKSGYRWVGNTLVMWSPSFELTVTCTDAAGNTKTKTVRPVFRRDYGKLEPE